MKKTILALLFVFAAICAAGQSQAAFEPPSFSGSTSGVGNDSINQSLAEEFTKCSAFNNVAAQCVKKTAGAENEKAAARREDIAKRFYKGSYALVGQDFTRKRVKFHDAAMRRNAGGACEDFPALEEMNRERCETTYRRLPRKFQ